MDDIFPIRVVFTFAVTFQRSRLTVGLALRPVDPATLHRAEAS